MPTAWKISEDRRRHAQAQRMDKLSHQTSPVPVQLAEERAHQMKNLSSPQDTWFLQSALVDRRVRSTSERSSRLDSCLQLPTLVGAYHSPEQEFRQVHICMSFASVSYLWPEQMSQCNDSIGFYVGSPLSLQATKAVLVRTSPYIRLCLNVI